MNIYTNIYTFAEQTSTAHTLPIIQGHIVNVIINQRQLLMRELKRTCLIQSDTDRLYFWITANFPSASNTWLRRQESTVVPNLGDVALISTCKPLREVTVIWSKKVFGLCYSDFPLLNSTEQYLEQTFYNGLLSTVSTHLFITNVTLASKIILA